MHTTNHEKLQKSLLLIQKM